MLLVGDIGGPSTLHVGDEAMFEADLDLVRRLVPKADCTAVSADPEHTASRYGIDAVPRLPPGTVREPTHIEADGPPAIRAAAEADLLVVTGGGNLNSSFPTMIAERLELARTTARNGGVIVLLGQMLGPGLTPGGAEKVGELLDLATFVGVRDPTSLDVARKLGVDASKVVEQLDDAWAMEGTVPTGVGVDLDRPFIAVTMHADARVVPPAAIRALGDELALVGSYSCAPIVLLPHCRAPEGPGGTTDEDVGAALAAQLQSRGALVHSLPVLAPADVIGLTRAAALVISSRYHPIVFAMSGCVPAVGIWADDYVRAKQLGALGHARSEEWMLELEAAIDGGLAPAAIEAWDRREELAAWLTVLRPSLSERAGQRDVLVGEWLHAAGITVRVPAMPAPSPVPPGVAPTPAGRWHALVGAPPTERPVPDPVLAELVELRKNARAVEVDRDALRSRVARGADPQVAPTPAARTTTVLDRIRLEVDADRIALVGRVSAPRLDETDVRLRVYSPELVARVDASATPFLPMMTVIAARLGTDLWIDAPVDERALENADRAAAILHDWWGWRPPRIAAAVTMPPTARSTGTGLWFSRGVDSMDTLLRALSGELVEDGQTVKITHLLGLDWIDEPLAVISTPDVWSDTCEAAGALGLPLLRFTTNIREVLDQLVPWDRSFAAVFAGLGLVLGPLLGSVLISAGAFEGEAAPPYGSHPVLDPLWSTSATRILHIGGTRGRCEKVARVASDPWALARLKVCWEVDTPRNCGRCGKCLATMTALYVAGALDRCDRFDSELSPAAVRRVTRAVRRLPYHPSTIADLLGNLPDDAVELRAAWEEYQERLARQSEADG